MFRIRQGTSDLQAQIEAAFDDLSAAPLGSLTQLTSTDVSAEDLVGCYRFSWRVYFANFLDSSLARHKDSRTSSI